MNKSEEHFKVFKEAEAEQGSLKQPTRKQSDLRRKSAGLRQTPSMVRNADELKDSPLNKDVIAESATVQPAATKKGTESRRLSYSYVEGKTLADKLPTDKSSRRLVELDETGQHATVKSAGITAEQEAADTSDEHQTTEYVEGKTLADKIGFDSAAKEDALENLGDHVALGRISLREGRFLFDDKTVGDFIYVPSEYNFDTRQGFDAILAALGIKPPDLVFQFGENYGVVPNMNEEETQAYYELRPKQYENSPENWTDREDLKYPHPLRDYYDMATKQTRVQNVLDSLADACKQSNSVYLLGAPDRGCVLAEMACKAGQNKGLTTLGLFFQGDFTNLKAEKEDESGRDFELYPTNTTSKDYGVPWSCYWSSRRQVLNPEVFADQNTVVTHGNTPKYAIPVCCNRTPTEERFLKAFRMQSIRNGLANECSHRLVFATENAKSRFFDKFVDLYPAGLVVAGSGNWEFEMAVECLKECRPIFVLENSGVVSNAVAELVRFGKLFRSGYFYGQRGVKIHDYIEKKFPPTEELGRQLALSDTIWKDAKVVASTFSSCAPNFNPIACDIFDVEDTLDVNSLQDKVTRVMGSVFDHVPELGGIEKDARALDKAEMLMETLKNARFRYRKGANILQAITRSSIFATTVLTVYQATEVSEEDDETLYDVLRTINIALPLATSVLISLEAALRPNLKYASFLLGQKRIESEMYRFRTRSGIYRVRGQDQSKEGSQDETELRSRNLFTRQCEDIFGECFNSDTTDGALFGRAQSVEDIRNKFKDRTQRSKAMGTQSFVVREESQMNLLKVGKSPTLGKSMKDVFVPPRYDDPEITVDLDGSLPDQEKDDMVNIPIVQAKHRHVLSAQEYLNSRVVDNVAKLSSHVPQKATYRLYMKFLVVALTASASGLTAMGVEAYVPVVLGAVALCDFIIGYCQLETRVQGMNAAAGELIKVWLWWTGLTLVQTRLPSYRDQLVNRSEEAMIAQYEQLAGYVVSSARRRHQEAEQAETQSQKAAEEGKREEGDNQAEGKKSR